MPWEAKFALPLTELIANKGKLQQFAETRLATYRKELEAKIKALVAKGPNATDPNDTVSQHFAKKLSALPSADEFAKRIPALEAALNKVFACEFPVIRVPQESFEDKTPDSSEVNIDPPLAILFKRVGTGGEPLSNADYVYAVIKHHAPEVHDTVEALLLNHNIRAIYTATTLVMSAVRLTILTLKPEDGKGQKLTDSAKLDKAAFARLVRNHPEFIERFKADIQPKGAFATRLKRVLDSMSYSTGFTTGMPKHALCLVQIPLLETILAWHTLKPSSADTLEQSRLPMVRFALQGNLCVLDYAKASEIAIRALKDGTVAASEIFPDQALMGLLSTGEKATAYPLLHPDTLDAIAGLTKSPDGTNGLRG